MLRVLQICNKAPYPANDGSSIAIYNMARGLLQNGVDLQLLTINTKKNFKPDEGVPSDFREKSAYRSVYRNTGVTLAGAFFNLFSSQSYFVSRFRFRAFSKALTEILLTKEFDIIQVEGLFMAVYLPEIRRYTKARVVLRAHNIEHVIWERHIAHEKSLLRKWYLALQNKRLKRFELKVFSEVDAVVPITGTDESNIRAMGCRKPLFTCITGINPKEYVRSGGKQKKNTVFYFGSMDWLPNQEAVTWFLDNCWDAIIEQIPGARFIIAGRGMPLHFFHITKPGVTIVEEVENPQQFFSQHQVMIVPLWSGSGLRIKIVEGMASGRAIISTSIGAEGIRYTHGRNILIADTAADFVTQVVRLLRDEELQQALGRQAALLAAEEFDNLRLVRELVNFYQGLQHA